MSAVYQHLHWGGLSYREMATLLPDGSGSKNVDQDALERVRKRIARGEARSLLPWSPP